MFRPHSQTDAAWEKTMALRVLQLDRSQLYLQLRYMNAALCALRWQASEKGNALATDGVTLLYPPHWILQIYRANPRYLPRAIMHSVLHCVFHHLWLRGKRNPAVWNIACDLAVEHLLDTWGVPILTRPVGWRRQQTYATLAKNCKILSAGPIYHALCTDPELANAETLSVLQREFYCDSHALWPADPDAPAAQVAGKQWEQLGRETQLSLQQDGRQAGSALDANTLAAQVQAGQSRRLYRDFLRKFATLREESHLDPDAFDLGYYTYGLSVYGNMPLIEPLETREVQKVRDFVIVLDTSDSTSGALVKAFLKETFTLLKTSDCFFSHCNIFVLQCDDAVRAETQLTDLDALERYMRTFTLHGGGGTDFRPAFARIEALQAKGLLKDLKGVLYFTDGKGIYPARRPPFETAFLFLDTGEAPPDTPPWAMKLVLEPEELLPTPPPRLPFDPEEMRDDDYPEELPNT